MCDQGSYNSLDCSQQLPPQVLPAFGRPSISVQLTINDSAQCAPCGPTPPRSFNGDACLADHFHGKALRARDESQKVPLTLQPSCASLQKTSRAVIEETYSQASNGAGSSERQPGGRPVQQAGPSCPPNTYSDRTAVNSSSLAAEGEPC